ncbi:MAG: inorganic phosphate transporter [Saprospiraceae bacterium]|nr:inorganic phosphate transporter [Candidatus Vicinibacter affinis]
MLGFDFGLEGTLLISFAVCILLVCFFEFVNGFHDTANAVATVIYTKSLKPIHAVIWSGFMNFLGVISSSYIFGMAVATKIAQLLPLESVLSRSTNEAIAMVASALVGAIIWNLGTWYFGIPCSSSHTLIGSLLGVGIAFTLVPDNNLKSGVNWNEAFKIGNALLFSPLFGFTMAIALMFILKRNVVDKAIFKEPEPEGKPPIWIRGLLIVTCTMVSFFHGSNDGQKGVGLMLIVLLAFVPTKFALAPEFNKEDCINRMVVLEKILVKESTQNFELERILCARAELIAGFADDVRKLDSKSNKEVMRVRKEMNVLAKELKLILAEPNAISSGANRKLIKAEIAYFNHNTNYVPFWIILSISISLGIGTMIGWRRIVVTIGEKIGKRHMTYAEGASAELIASSTIGLASGLGLPVSTTHVLSSGVAGAMVATKGIKNLQAATIKNIVLAWVLTLPATMIISAVLFFLARMLML